MNRSPHYTAAWLICAAIFLTACAGTRLAYKTADTPVETASVVAEHYYALVKQAADLKDAGSLTGSALAKVQAADRAAKPLVVELTKAVEAYQAVKSADTEAALQVALSQAVLSVNSFITTLRSVRGA